MSLSDPIIEPTGCCDKTPAVGDQTQGELAALTARVRALEIDNAAMQADINNLKLQAIKCIDVDFVNQTFSYTTFAGVVTNG